MCDEHLANRTRKRRNKQEKKMHINHWRRKRNGGGEKERVEREQVSNKMLQTQNLTGDHHAVYVCVRYENQIEKAQNLVVEKGKRAKKRREESIFTWEF